MPDRVFALPDAHTSDVLDYSFVFEGFGSGDDVATYTPTVPGAVTLADDSKSAQTVTLRLGPVSAAGTYRIIVAAVSDAGQQATIEADWTVADPA